MKPQFKLEKIYLNLSKLSEEQQRKVIALLPPKKRDNQYEIQKVHFILYLDKKKKWWVWGTKIKNKTELTYSQFLDMMGESEEVLQVENNSWIKIESEKDLPKEDISCWWMDKKDGMILGKFLIENNNSDIDFILENATHYQPLIIPEPPKF